MVSSLATLELNSLILHQVPRAKRNDEAPDPVIHSQAIVDLGNEQRLYMQHRLRKSLASTPQAREVQEAPNHGSPIPDLIRKLLLDDGCDYVEDSQTMANHLRKVQAGGSPNGLFLFGRCRWGGNAAVLIAKVELEKGVQVNQIENLAGLATYDMTLLENLVFGQTSKVYKVGLFGVADLAPKSNLLTGIAIDEQIGGAGVTKLFLLDYLGCEYVADSAELTRKFYIGATEHFTLAVADPIKKATYMIALVTELHSNKANLDATRFAKDFLDEEDQQPFVNRLARMGVPTSAFPKSVEYVPMNQIQYETDTEVIIIADREKVDNGVIEVKANSVVVKGGVKKVSTKGRRSRESKKDEGESDVPKKRVVAKARKIGESVREPSKKGTN